MITVESFIQKIMNWWYNYDPPSHLMCKLCMFKVLNKLLYIIYNFLQCIYKWQNVTLNEIFSCLFDLGRLMWAQFLLWAKDLHVKTTADFVFGFSNLYFKFIASGYFYGILFIGRDVSLIFYCFWEYGSVLKSVKIMSIVKYYANKRFELKIYLWINY